MLYDLILEMSVVQRPNRVIVADSPEDSWKLQLHMLNKLLMIEARLAEPNASKRTLMLTAMMFFPPGTGL